MERPPHLPPETPPWQGERDELRTELRYRQLAIPIAIVLALLFHQFALGRFLQRTFLSMMVHEVGHAVTAWLSGFAAFPFVWRTMIAASRGPVTILAVAGAAIAMIVWGRREERRDAVIGGAAILVVQLIFTLTPSRIAGARIAFGGDGGAMILGTLLMCSFFAGRDTQIYRGALRWGFLVIGAAAFVDTFATWWQARRDYDVIPFGEIEGVGLSDPSKLLEVYGWTTRQIVSRYVTLGCFCLATLAVVYVLGVRQARRALARS